MCCESFWKGAIVFCLTFGLSVFASNLFIPSRCTAEIKQFEVKQTIRSFEPQELKKDASVKPLCKKYADESVEKLVQLMKTKSEILKSLQSKSLSQKQKENYLQKLKKLEKKIDDYKKTFNKRDDLPNESMPLHNLVYVEKCIEY